MIEVNFKKAVDGLLPAIVQDVSSGRVLMLAYINEQALEMTIKTGMAHYWSRSRKQLWLKGESSGNYQAIREIRIDCDKDTILYIVEQKGGAACHEGYPSCFFRKIDGNELRIIEERVFDPKTVYKQ